MYAVFMPCNTGNLQQGFELQSCVVSLFSNESHPDGVHGVENRRNVASNEI